MKIKSEFFISKLVMVSLIVIPMAFVMTAVNTGLTPMLLRVYPRNLLIAFLAAYPCSLAVHPLAEHITKRLMHK
jgi:hypothetical protein